MISKAQVGIADAQAKKQADREIRRDSRPIIKDTLASIRSQMRSLGLFESGLTDRSFKHKFKNKDGQLEGIQFLAQRNAFVLAHAGQDYRWSLVQGRRKLFNMKDSDDFVFPYIDTATDQIADVVAKHRADAVVRGTNFLNKNIPDK